MEKGTPCLNPGRIEDKVGLRASNVTELTLEDVRVPAENLIGKKGGGFKLCMMTLDAVQALGGYGVMKDHRWSV